MKKVFNYLAVAASAILVLSACTSDKLEAYSGQPDTNPESPDNAIQFGTYTAQSGVTRGGAYGAIDNSKLQSEGYGFGVFAYSTGNTDYSGYRTQNETAERFPNFMYNEKVYFSSTKWKYDNIKYWPNEIGDTETANDDQNNDSGNDPAKGSGSNGGKLSFFAYAPYATATVTKNTKISGQTTTDHAATTSGVVAISGNGYNGNDGDNTDSDGDDGGETKYYSDPYIKYVISDDSKEQVDLLWGTADNSSENVVSETTQGGAATTTYDAASGNTAYVNTDITKQKTTGTVNFKFKHALAKIGGSSINTGGKGSDDDPTTVTNGLMIVLDIDKDGKETTGSLNPYTGGSITANTKYNTKVTVNEITVTSGKQLTGKGLKAIQTNSKDFSYESSTYTEDLKNTGILNLATGKWSDLSKTGTASSTRTQTIEPSVDNGGTTDQDKDAILASEIAEPNNFTAAGRSNLTKEGFESLPIGVTTVPKNVYKTESQPFVFIPGTYPILTFAITYTVRTYDPNLYNAYTEVKQKVTKRLYILDEIELNKQYNILMHLGLTGVKFSATVSNWDLADPNESGSTDGVGGSTIINTAEDGSEHVYLPINVAELTEIAAATPANLAFDWHSSSDAESETKNIGALTLTYSDGTTHKTNDKVGGTGANKDELVMPSITFTPTSGECKIEKHLESSIWDGTFDITWTKNKGVNTRTQVLTFTYGNQTATLTSTQGVGPLQVTTTGSPFAAKGATGTSFLTVKAANGQGEEQFDYTINWTASEPTWATINTSNGQVTLTANNQSTEERNATFTVTKGNASSSPSTEIKQKGYSLKASVSGTTVTVTDGDDQNVDLSTGFTIKDSDNSNVTPPTSGNTFTGTSGKSYTITHTASGASVTTNVI